MKRLLKKSSLLIVASIVFFMMLPVKAEAGNVIKASASVSGKNITVSGSVSDDVSAVMIFIYYPSDLSSPISVETAEVNASSKTFSHRLNEGYPDDTYTIRVADYNGGAYYTINNVKISTPKPKPATTTTKPATTSTNKTTTSNKKKDSAPKTGDPFHGTPVPALAIVAILSCMGAAVLSIDRKSR